METGRELKDYEESKIYVLYDGKVGINIKDSNNRIIVDKDGFEHSFNDKPAFIGYDYDGREEIWRKHGKLHRLTGPAFISYNEYGKIIDKEYWINYVEFSQQDWETEVNRLEMLNEIK